MTEIYPITLLVALLTIRRGYNALLLHGTCCALCVFTHDATRFGHLAAILLLALNILNVSYLKHLPSITRIRRAPQNDQHLIVASAAAYFASLVYALSYSGTLATLTSGIVIISGLCSAGFSGFSRQIVGILFTMNGVFILAANTPHHIVFWLVLLLWLGLMSLCLRHTQRQKGLI